MRQFTQLGTLAAFSLPTLVSPALAEGDVIVYTYVCEGVIQSLGSANYVINYQFFESKSQKNIEAVIEFIAGDSYNVWTHYDKGLRQKSEAFSKELATELANEGTNKWVREEFFNFRVICASLEELNYFGSEELKKAFLRYKARVTPFIKQFNEHSFGGKKLDAQTTEYLVLLTDIETVINRIRENVTQCVEKKITPEEATLAIRNLSAFQRAITAEMANIQGKDADKFREVYHALGAQTSISTALAKLQEEVKELTALNYLGNKELKEIFENSDKK